MQLRDSSGEGEGFGMEDSLEISSEFYLKRGLLSIGLAEMAKVCAIIHTSICKITVMVTTS
jgi:hypothetical protein